MVWLVRRMPKISTVPATERYINGCTMDLENTSNALFRFAITQNSFLLARALLGGGWGRWRFGACGIDEIHDVVHQVTLLASATAHP